MLPLREEDRALRLPVWEALSTLFLDTDTSLLRDYRAKVLAASPYSIPQLEEILISEVYPVLRSNLLSLAGEWAGFDPEWLEERIRKHVASGPGLLRALNLGRLTVPLSREWRLTKSAVDATRLSLGSHASST